MMCFSVRSLWIRKLMKFHAKIWICFRFGDQHLAAPRMFEWTTSSSNVILLKPVIGITIGLRPCHIPIIQTCITYSITHTWVDEVIIDFVGCFHYPFSLHWHFYRQCFCSLIINLRLLAKLNSTWPARILSPWVLTNEDALPIKQGDKGIDT